MSQMPDKIWLHKDTKYNTVEVVSAYQYEFAQEIECEGIENFVEYVPADTFIEKACEWLSKHAKKYYFNKDEHYLGTDELIEDFKLSMKLWNNTFQNPL